MEYWNIGYLITFRTYAHSLKIIVIFYYFIREVRISFKFKHIDFLHLHFFTQFEMNIFKFKTALLKKNYWNLRKVLSGGGGGVYY